MMYKKLEDDQPVIAAASDQAETECVCPCGAEATDAGDGEPEANKTFTALPIYYDANGGGLS